MDIWLKVGTTSLLFMVAAFVVGVSSLPDERGKSIEWLDKLCGLVLIASGLSMFVSLIASIWF